MVCVGGDQFEARVTAFRLFLQPNYIFFYPEFQIASIMEIVFAAKLYFLSLNLKLHFIFILQTVQN